MPPTATTLSCPAVPQPYPFPTRSSPLATTSDPSPLGPTTLLPSSNIGQPSPPPALTTSSHSMVTHAKDGIRQPNPKYALLAINVDDLVEPTCFNQANKYHEWRQAMAEEFCTPTHRYMDTCSLSATFQCSSQQMGVSHQA